MLQIYIVYTSVRREERTRETCKIDIDISNSLITCHRTSKTFQPVPGLIKETDSFSKPTRQSPAPVSLAIGSSFRPHDKENKERLCNANTERKKHVYWES